MDEFLKICTIVCPLVFLGGFVDSIAGGGGLITLPAYMMAGVPVHLAAGTNKVAAGSGALVAALRFFRSGKVRLLIALCAGAGAMAGGSIGASFAARLSDRLLRGLMLTALPLIAVFLAVRKDFGQEETAGKEYSRTYQVLMSLLTGLAIGCYDGLIGPGTGTFLIMAFTALLNLDMVTASGCGKAANLASNAASAVTFAVSGMVLWKVVVPAAVCSMLGNYCGAQYAIRGGGVKIRRMIFAVLGLMFVKLLADLITG